MVEVGWLGRTERAVEAGAGDEEGWRVTDWDCGCGGPKDRDADGGTGRGCGGLVDCGSGSEVGMRSELKRKATLRRTVMSESWSASRRTAHPPASAI